MTKSDDLFNEWNGSSPEPGEGLYAHIQREQKQHEEWVAKQPPLTLTEIFEKLAEISEAQRNDPMYGKLKVSGVDVLGLNDEWFISTIRSKNVIAFCGIDTAKAIEERAHKLGYNIDGTKHTNA